MYLKIKLFFIFYIKIKNNNIKNNNIKNIKNNNIKQLKTFYI